MMTDNNDNSAILKDENSTDNKKRILTEETFNILRLAQSKIRDETDIFPTFRKMISELVNQETVDKLVERYIKLLA